jgi:hypothetical protein
MTRVLLTVLLAACSCLDGAVFRAGVQEVDITPQRFPIRVSGGFLAGTAERALDELKARALALDDGKTRLVISVVDTLMMPREMLDRVKETAARRTGIPVERMLISATHTHKAPPLMGALGTDAEPEYARFVEGRIVEAIEAAALNLTPARVGWTAVDAPAYTHCRRWILRPDKMRPDPFGNVTVRANMHPGWQNPEFLGPSGPVDPRLSMLALATADGKPLALLANYSMHYVGEGGKVVSSDYYGPFCAAVQRLAGETGGRFLVMMSQGTSGDQHWMDYSGPKQTVDRRSYGETLAGIAYEAFRGIEYRDWAPLAMADKKLRLRRRIPDRQRLEWARAVIREMGDRPPKDLKEVYAREQIYLHGEPERELRLQALRVGDVGIATFPNEVFAITGLKIKTQSPLALTFNIELANGAEGYIPPPEQHRLGGYTTWPARTAALEPQAEPKIVAALVGLLEKVAGAKRRAVAQDADAYAKSVLASRPKAYWRGEEFSDRTAFGRVEGGIAFYLEGAVGRAPQFAGGHLRMRRKLYGPSSVEFWFRNLLPVDARPVTGYLLSAGSELALAVGGASGAAGRLVLEAGGARFEGRSLLELGGWHHAALVRTRDQVLVYLDGRQTPEIHASPLSSLRAGELWMAGRAGSAESFEGLIDEVAVYSRALEPVEISDHFKERNHGSSNQTGVRGRVDGGVERARAGRQ